MKKLLIILAILAIILVPTILFSRWGFPVAIPHIQLPAEKVWLEPLTLFGIDFYFYNSMTEVLLADLLVIIGLLIVGRQATKRLDLYETNHQAVDIDTGEDVMVPRGWWNIVESIFDYFYNLVRTIAGKKHAHAIFAVVMTIFVYVLTLNMLHFVPGVDSIGIMHCAEPGVTKGFLAQEIGSTGIYRLAFSDEVGPVGVEPTYDAEACEIVHHAAVAAAEGEEAHGEAEDLPEILYTLAPFARTGTTDLNLTLSIAVLAMLSVQVFGVRELGPGYFLKFFNIKAFKKGAIGIIDFFVGLLELISEFSKVISFTLRLFGNIFAGSILLIVIMFLIPTGVPLVFYLIEVLIGFIQALVFAVLTLVLIALGMAGHGDHDEKHESHQEGS